MTRTTYLRGLADDRATDHAIAAITRNFKRGLISETVAIRQMREQGACEPEIADMIEGR